MVQPTGENSKLLACGCKVEDAEPYGDCLTFGPGHYEVWEGWRKARLSDSGFELADPVS